MSYYALNINSLQQPYAEGDLDKEHLQGLRQITGEKDMKWGWTRRYIKRFLPWAQQRHVKVAEVHKRDHQGPGGRLLGFWYGDWLQRHDTLQPAWSRSDSHLSVVDDVDPSGSWCVQRRRRCLHEFLQDRLPGRLQTRRRLTVGRDQAGATHPVAHTHERCLPAGSRVFTCTCAQVCMRSQMLSSIYLGRQSSSSLNI